MLFFGAALLVCACSTPPPPVPAPGYYVTSEIAYLRDGPSYTDRVLGQLYKGDQVAKLEANSADWWRVQSGRSGQVGWIQGDLLSLSPVVVRYYYVVPQTVPLRECAGAECPSLQLLYRGDKVQQVEKNNKGWWRVLLPGGRGLGWLPETALSTTLVLAPPPAPIKKAPHLAAPPAATGPPQAFLYVAIDSLALRQLPLNTGQVVKTLPFNDQLQKVEESPAGWIKVRQVSSGAAGWVFGRYLATAPLKAPRPLPRRHEPTPGPAKPKPAGPPPEPEVM